MPRPALSAAARTARAPAASRLLAVLAALALPPTPAVATDEALAAAWDTGARLRFDEAARAFRALAEAPGAIGREARYGRAVMLLNVQPRTVANVRESERLLAEVRAADPADDLGVGALYHLARLAQYHEREPQLDRARALYAELLDRHGDHELGQQAGLRLAILALYATDLDLPLAERLAQAEELGARLVDPAVRRDFHLAIAPAWIRLGGDRARALEHLLAAEATGTLRRDVDRSGTLVQAGALAAELGRTDVARRAWGDFLAAFPRDTRAATVRRRLAALDAGPAGEEVRP